MKDTGFHPLFKGQAASPALGSLTAGLDLDPHRRGPQAQPRMSPSSQGLGLHACLSIPNPSSA